MLLFIALNRYSIARFTGGNVGSGNRNTKNPSCISQRGMPQYVIDL